MGESFLLRCLLEKETFEFCLVREILQQNRPVVLKHQESDIISNFVPAAVWQIIKGKGYFTHLNIFSPLKGQTLAF